MVREAVERRRGRRLRRRCCAANPPLGPWCVLRAVGEAVPMPGQLLRVTPASWLKAPKRRRGRTTSLSLALGEGGRGRRRRDNWLGKLPVLNPAARGKCSRRAGDAGPGTGFRVSGKGRAKVGCRSFCARVLAGAQFPGTFLIDGYVSRAFPSVSRRSHGLKIHRRVPSFLGKIFSFELLKKAASFKF